MIDSESHIIRLLFSISVQESLSVEPTLERINLNVYDVITSREIFLYFYFFHEFPRAKCR